MDGSLNKPRGLGRAPHIVAALSVPVSEAGEIDFDVFARDLERTAGYGIEPAVLMDTYQINHCTPEQQVKGLETAREVMNGRPFTAGVYVEDEISGDGIEDIIRAYRGENRATGRAIRRESDRLSDRALEERRSLHHRTCLRGSGRSFERRSKGVRTQPGLRAERLDVPG